MGRLFLLHSHLLPWGLLCATATISTSSKLSAHGVRPLPYSNGEPAAHRDSLKALSLGVQGQKRDLLSPLLPQGHLLSSPCHTTHMRLTRTVSHAEATNTRQLAHIARTHAARPPPAHTKAAYTAAAARGPLPRACRRSQREIWNVFIDELRFRANLFRETVRWPSPWAAAEDAQTAQPPGRRAGPFSSEPCTEGQMRSSRLAVGCAPSAEGAAGSFANPSLEVKLQTLAKEKGCVEGESTGLPPTPEGRTT